MACRQVRPDVDQQASPRGAISFRVAVPVAPDYDADAHALADDQRAWYYASCGTGRRVLLRTSLNRVGTAVNISEGGAPAGRCGYHCGRSGCVEVDSPLGLGQLIPAVW